MEQLVHREWRGKGSEQGQMEYVSIGEPQPGAICIMHGREELYCHIPRVYGTRRLVEVEHAKNTTTTLPLLSRLDYSVRFLVRFVSKLSNDICRYVGR